ncbi:MAG: sigma-70 family RNA polymerase sigma factor [Oscillospiraceae bacterium]|nr:sigma-70 family RNA polymerase sigma factor [Oscillospiraceae bacterium]
MLTLIISAIEDDYERAFMIKLYEDYYDYMRKKAFSFVRNDDEAEELVHDAFVNLIENVKVVIKVDPKKLPSYIMSTIRNVCINKWKKNNREHELSFSMDDSDLAKWIKDDKALPEDIYIKKESLYRMNKAILLLSERDRLLLEAKYVLRQKDEDIGKQFDIAPKNVRIYVMRARRKAFALMEEVPVNEK